MPVYAKVRGKGLILPISYPAANPIGTIYIDGTVGNALTFRDYTSTDIPLIGGTLTSSELLLKRKRNNTALTISVDTVVALKVDGSICPVDSNDPTATEAIGTTTEPISAGSYGTILLIGPNSPNVCDGFGFTTGDIIYEGSTPGSLVNSLAAIVGAVKVVGIADCPSDTMSAIATDLILTNGNSGSGGGGSVMVTASATIVRGSPVTINASGQLAVVDITNEDSAYAFCGVTSIDCLTSGIDTVLTAGSVLTDIPASYGLTGQYGKHIFVSHTGSLTLVKPTVGNGGFLSQDFILSVGVTTRNPATGTTDLILNPRIIGQIV